MPILPDEEPLADQYSMARMAEARIRDQDAEIEALREENAALEAKLERAQAAVRSYDRVLKRLRREEGSTSELWGKLCGVIDHQADGHAQAIALAIEAAEPAGETM